MTSTVSHNVVSVMKRVEVLAVILAGVIVSYLVGYYDGAHAKHHTVIYEVSNGHTASQVSR